MTKQQPLYQIRADFRRDTLVVYQAYRDAIARPAIQTGRFQPPFSTHRMTWIKPSFLWLMARSQWGQKSGQENILAIHIRRDGWEQALAEAVLTSPEQRVYRNAQEWEERFANARVHVQWDPERSLRGAFLPYRSIQVGLSRHIIEEYCTEWIVQIEDYTPLTHKIRQLCKQGRFAQAQKLLPSEREYTLPHHIAKNIGQD